MARPILRFFRNIILVELPAFLVALVYPLFLVLVASVKTIL